MVPKVETAAQIVATDLLLRPGRDQAAGLPVGHIGIEAQIETARGLINVEEICAASPRLETIIFGPADFAASMEMPVLTGGVQIPAYPGDHFHYVFSKILMAGRANGLQVIDGPYLYIRDPEGFRDYCQRTRTLGYDGKWALHPDQVTILNEVFSPTQEQFDKAWDILEAYEHATEGEGKGAVMFGDEMIDEASRKMALKFVSRGERAGLQRTLRLSVTAHRRRRRRARSAGSSRPTSLARPRCRVVCSPAASTVRRRPRRSRPSRRPAPNRHRPLASSTGAPVRLGARRREGASDAGRRAVVRPALRAVDLGAS